MNEVKPHLYFWRGVWCCIAGFSMPIGHGDSPLEAFQDWLAQSRRSTK